MKNKTEDLEEMKKGVRDSDKKAIQNAEEIIELYKNKKDLSPEGKELFQKAEEIVRLFRDKEYEEAIKKETEISNKNIQQGEKILKKGLSEVLIKKEEGKMVKSDAPIETDLLDAVADMIAVQIHFTNSYRQTGDVKYLELSKAIREIRGKAQMRLVANLDNENWCVSKHILFSYRSLTEVADKLMSMDKVDLAKEISGISKDLLELFVLLQKMAKEKNPKCIINW